MPKISFTTGEADKSIEIMREVAQWCLDTNKNMWPFEILNRKTLANPENEFVIAYADGVPAGTMILSWHDPSVWPESPAGEAGYIHKLATRREFAGQGISRELFDFAKSECRRRGTKYLRLDTGSRRYKLHELYESNGFNRVEIKQLGHYICVKYECAVGSEN